MIVNCFYNKKIKGNIVTDLKEYSSIIGSSYYMSKDEITKSPFNDYFPCFGKASGSNLSNFNNVICYTIIDFYHGELEKSEENQKLY